MNTFLQDTEWPFPDSDNCKFIPIETSNASLWQTLLDRLPNQPVGYHRLHCDYQHAYFAAAYPRYRQLDSLIVVNGEPVGIWPLAVWCDQDSIRLSSHVNGAYGIAPPLLHPELTVRQRKAIHQVWLGTIAKLATDTNMAGPSQLRFISDGPWTNVPDWATRLLSCGARLTGRYRMVADLGGSNADYHRQIRKSYKSLINKAENTWLVELDQIGDSSAFAEFQALHEQVAGRKTRSPETWKLQFEAINAGAAFAVYLRSEGRLVGASLYNISLREAYYAVGAYDRSLFDQPVAHLSLFRAIGYARTTGRQTFILGDRTFPGNMPPPNEKEARIAFFKEGFATALQLLPVLEMTVSEIVSYVSTMEP